jgi:hypothetical protein
MISLVVSGYSSSPDLRLGLITIGATSLSSLLKCRKTILRMLRGEVKIRLKDLAVAVRCNFGVKLPREVLLWTAPW